MTNLSGEKIKKIREARGLTQMDLAVAIDCDPQFISKIERNEHKRISLDSAMKLSKYFRISIYEIVI